MISIDQAKINWIVSESRRVVLANREELSRRGLPNAHQRRERPGVWYSPGGPYRGLWTIDFCYLVEGLPEALDVWDIKFAYYLLLRYQRADGGVPFYISVDEEAGYETRHNSSQESRKFEFTDANNSPFLVKIAYAYYLHTGDLELVASTIQRLKRAMDNVPLGRHGLVWIDPDNPYTGYGYTDSILKRGYDLFCTIAYWEAARIMEKFYQLLGCPREAMDFVERAQRIEENLEILWDDAQGAYLSDSDGERKVDIWGNAYLSSLNMPVRRRGAVDAFLLNRLDDYTWRGQVRHLLNGEFWDHPIIKWKPGEYQQGAYWGAASGWVMQAVAKTNPQRAEQMANELIDYFQSVGVFECVNEGYTKGKDYVSSILNPLAALKKLLPPEQVARAFTEAGMNYRTT